MAGFILGSDNLSSTPTAGTLEYFQNSLFFTGTTNVRGLIPSRQFFILGGSGFAGQNATGNQSIFGLSTGVVLNSNTVYAFESAFALSRTAGTTAHTISNGFGGTATFNNISYYNLNEGNSTAFSSIASLYNLFIQSSSQTPVTTTVSSSSLYINFVMKGIISVNAGGTLLPQYSLSAAPGGAYTTQPGSYFLIYPIATGSLSSSSISVGSFS
jgi:hypothetical protein